ncbi:hypothetical protein GCM10025865_00960 [Paraoerskovia sediminicola]|uniref:Holliday junction resolvase RusA (Prophage-encoded endonuclease) n=1 Tax=Paraoerskovia sediminicola TaxID=1138587 RepID=A0ABN6X821_9CELL|nr:RusA family crossover junction endodeoxyribonuclease [Paraoerskovia sediminicola]BDZ40797.1 hypothetical protein GCM10025865_00960 [Paraoerskovia sediminicola]
MTAVDQPLFVGLPSEAQVICRFRTDGEPVSKSRARFTKRGSKVHTYTPQHTKDAEAAVALQFARNGGRLCADADVTFGVAATFYHGTRQRRDVDNMLKLILDGLNGVAWVDDNQVVEVAGRKAYIGRAGDAHTEVVIYRVGLIERDKKNCAFCGSEFQTYYSWDKKKHCSAECTRQSRIKRRERTCVECGETFLAHGPERETKFCSMDCMSRNGRIDIDCAVCGTTFSQVKSWVAQGRVYCSAECSRKHSVLAARERRTTTFRGVCRVCGGGTTRKEYTRCNICRRAGLDIEDAL